MPCSRPAKPFRIGCGAGYSGDRIDPEQALAERGGLNALVFECLAERTIALAQLRRIREPAHGYDPLLEARMRSVLPACVRGGVTVITNMGAAHPEAAGAAVLAVARELGLPRLRAGATPPEAWCRCWSFEPKPIVPMKLQDIAIARSGDKGNRATLSVIALDPADYPVLERLLGVERVQAHFEGVVHGRIQRFTLPHLGAVHFVMDDVLAGGVTRSLALDAHGKTLSAALLDIAIDDDVTG